MNDRLIKFQLELMEQTLRGEQRWGAKNDCALQNAGVWKLRTKSHNVVWNLNYEFYQSRSGDYCPICNNDESNIG